MRTAKRVHACSFAARFILLHSAHQILSNLNWLKEGFGVGIAVFKVLLQTNLVLFALTTISIIENLLVFGNNNNNNMINRLDLNKVCVQLFLNNTRVSLV